MAGVVCVLARHLRYKRDNDDQQCSKLYPCCASKEQGVAQYNSPSQNEWTSYVFSCVFTSNLFFLK